MNIFGTASEGDALYFDSGDRLRFFQNGSASGRHTESEIENK